MQNDAEQTAEHHYPNALRYDARLRISELRLVSESMTLDHYTNSCCRYRHAQVLISQEAHLENWQIAVFFEYGVLVDTTRYGSFLMLPVPPESLSGPKAGVLKAESRGCPNFCSWEVRLFVSRRHVEMILCTLKMRCPRIWLEEGVDFHLYPGVMLSPRVFQCNLSNYRYIQEAMRNSVRPSSDCHSPKPC